MDDTSLNAFWAEMSPCDHFVQIYETDEVFMDALVEFVRGGLKIGHAAVVIATPSHRHELDKRLTAMGIDVASARSEDQFISIDAEEMLSKFMVDGWPDDNLFSNVVTDVLKRAGRKDRKVRAFGELVALLWAQGHGPATIRLEHLWNNLREKELFPLFCAYPKAGFGDAVTDTIASICAAHSRVLDAVWPIQGVASCASSHISEKVA